MHVSMCTAGICVVGLVVDMLVYAGLVAPAACMYSMPQHHAPTQSISVPPPPPPLPPVLCLPSSASAAAAAAAATFVTAAAAASTSAACTSDS